MIEILHKENVSGSISHEDSPPCSKAGFEGETRTCSPAPSACQLFAQVLGHYSLECFVGRILFSKNENFTVSMNLARSGDFKGNSIVTHEKRKGESYEKKESQDQKKFLQNRLESHLLLTTQKRRVLN